MQGLGDEEALADLAFGNKPVLRVPLGTPFTEPSEGVRVGGRRHPSAPEARFGLQHPHRVLEPPAARRGEASIGEAREERFFAFPRQERVVRAIVAQVAARLALEVDRPGPNVFSPEHFPLGLDPLRQGLVADRQCTQARHVEQRRVVHSRRTSRTCFPSGSIRASMLLAAAEGSTAGSLQSTSSLIVVLFEDRGRGNDMDSNPLVLGESGSHDHGHDAFL